MLFIHLEYYHKIGCSWERKIAEKMPVKLVIVTEIDKIEKNEKGTIDKKTIA